MTGVDFLCFDTTNAVLYLDTVDIILRVLSEYAAAGWDVPKFMFYIAASDKSCIKTVYEKYYSKGLYKELWFAPKGKPMITQMYSTEWNEADPTEAAISGFFEFRFLPVGLQTAFLEKAGRGSSSNILSPFIRIWSAFPPHSIPA